MLDYLEDEVRRTADMFCLSAYRRGECPSAIECMSSGNTSESTIAFRPPYSKMLRTMAHDPAAITSLACYTGCLGLFTAVIRLVVPICADMRMRRSRIICRNCLTAWSSASRSLLMGVRHNMRIWRCANLKFEIPNR